jgi:hypothetical protein
MIFCSVVQCCYVIIYNTVDYFKVSDLYNPYNFLDWFNLVLIFFCILFLCILIYALYRHHRYEFIRLKVNLFIELFFYMIILIIGILKIIYINLKDSEDQNLEFWNIYYYLLLDLQLDSNILMYYIILL